MAGSLSFHKQYCIPKGKASAGYRFADHSRSGGKALSRAEIWKRGMVRSEPSCSRHWRYKSRRMDLTPRPRRRLWQHPVFFMTVTAQYSNPHKMLHTPPAAIRWLEAPSLPPPARILIWSRWLVSSHRVPSMGANAFWNSFGSASAMTLTLAILPGRLAPAISIIGSPRRTTERGLTKTLPTTPSIIDRSLASSQSAATGAQSASCEADDIVAICRSRASPSPPNDVSRTNGRWRMIGSTESVVIGSLLVGWSRLVSRFGQRPQPRDRRKNRVPGQRQQKLAGESLLAGAGSRGRDCAFSRPNVPRAGK